MIAFIVGAVIGSIVGVYLAYSRYRARAARRLALHRERYYKIMEGYGYSRQDVVNLTRRATEGYE